MLELKVTSLLATLLYLALAAAFSVYVIGQKKEPGVTLSWILAFFFLPYIGMLFFLLVGYRRYQRKRSHKLIGHLSEVSEPFIGPPEASSLDSEIAELEKMGSHFTGFPPTGGNRITVYQEASDTDLALAGAIKNAVHHVHLEYYIFKPDDKGEFYANLLIEAASRGVECRLLVDAIGSFWLRKKWMDVMKGAGVQVEFFQPLKIQSPWGFHLRNHRKLAIIDGQAALMGSQNIANDVTTWRRRLISWRETNVLIEGPAVDYIQKIFAEDWRFASGEHLNGRRYYPEKKSLGGARVQFIPTGPQTKENILQILFVTALYAAHERITVTTPYFIPTSAVVLALQSAVRRGLRVEMLLPRLSDQPLTLYAARSWYQELIESGVKIYENAKRFIHAKVVTIDDKAALVGSANMDNRSFLINFESSLLIYDRDATRALIAGFEESVLQSREVQLDTLRRQPFARSIVEGAARILSPLL